MGLNERQLDILRWIGEGTPERKWPDWSHRTTAKALQSRGLVNVRGRGPTWTATVTDHGRRVLLGEVEVPAPGAITATRKNMTTSKSGRNATLAGPAQRVMVDPEDLIADLLIAADHRLHVPGPDVATRAAYRRALAGIPADLVPTGKRVTHTGRNRGDLVICLVDVPDPLPPVPVVVVPAPGNEDDPLIAWLIRHPEAVHVADSSRDRALVIIQGVAEAITKLGYRIAPPPTPSNAEGRDSQAWVESPVRGSVPYPELPTFEVRFGDQVLGVELYEEQERVMTVPPEEATKLKYEWQRARPVQSWSFNGRLALRIRGHSGTPGWADGKRWTLESRLPRFVRTIEKVIQQRTETHRRAQEAKHRRRQDWEDALPRARAAYVADLNRTRLNHQLEQFAEAENMRAYAEAVARRASALEPAQRAEAEAWAAWIHTEADRHDSTFKSDDLALEEPEEIRSWDLDKYMPPGMTASRPPD